VSRKSNIDYTVAKAHCHRPQVSQHIIVFSARVRVFVLRAEELLWYVRFPQRPKILFASSFEINTPRKMAENPTSAGGMQQRVHVLLKFLNGLASGELDYQRFDGTLVGCVRCGFVPRDSSVVVLDSPSDAVCIRISLSLSYSRAHSLCIDYCSTVLRVATREVIRDEAVVSFLPRGLAAEKNPGATRLVLKVLHKRACSDDAEGRESPSVLVLNEVVREMNDGVRERGSLKDCSREL
jgi:hypothetical protein